MILNEWLVVFVFVIGLSLVEMAGNGVVHSLAKYVLNIPNFETWMEEAPKFLLPSLQVDNSV